MSRNKHSRTDDHFGPDLDSNIVLDGAVGAIPDGTDLHTALGLLGTSMVAALDDLTDVVITTPAENDTLRLRSGDWVNDNRRWEPVTHDPGTGPEIVFDSTDIVMTWEPY